ncbi:crossover junction endodeoxyribonuclease RuvC [Spiribacter aquaticus]|jgi:crossover junction endodeoxyribonuclease RuvC|uniref:Crossover junction endodeoxyribonuclease RuvC n=1 Tax=Spiribacter aquaticus TaxID=1935996 RepID=A0A557RKE4_9GAMM|nr:MULTISPECIES: crossover junction endodeoxyribonuclease RuvC [Spiribacter]KAF0279832.1 crossover junction endodeoxyribonuclease RuvC [Spiribacter roseus]PZA01153.1 crossover junction endodeoxyribonuclease RuvC [Gammaproteobacteria bacterium 2W06]TVO65644.1 crossover junction endodeoxyribonuclease RuvC [Spiribacter aquaticus]
MAAAGGERRILGIDPGSVRTGFGIVAVDGARSRYIASGVIQAGSGAFAERLHTIFAGLTEVIAEHAATESAIEEVFVNRNIQSALKLGQARGAAICACAGAGLSVAEYSARAIKQALVGRGGAEKTQVGYMVRTVLGLQGELREDAADALAVALSHAQHDRFRRQMARSSPGGAA